MLKKYHGVTYVQRTTGGTINLFWRDPRVADKKRRGKMTALGTNDTETANTVAEQLSRLIGNPKLPADKFHALTQKAWQPVDSAQDALDDAVLTTAEPPKPGTPKYARWLEMMQKITALQKEVADLLTIKTDRDRLGLECTQLKARLRKMDVKAVLDAQPISITDAIKQFFESGVCEATGNWKYALQRWFERVGDEFGKDVDVHTLTPEMIRDHINKQDCSADTKRRLKINLCNFLRFATKENFDERTLNEYTKNLKKKAKQETNNKAWYWLTKRQVLALIKQLKAEYGQYVADAAMIQWACGVRSEELVLLQRQGVKKEKGKYSIHIARIFDGSKLVRKVKTDKSEGYVEVPNFALPALKRRLKGNEFLLFPCEKPGEWMEPRCYDAQTEFEKANKLWHVPPEQKGDKTAEYSWSAFYTPCLRSAGAKVKDAREIDGRTLRRTCGRELILKYGFDRASSVLRDDITTLRSHYADLQSHDTSTER